LKRGFLKIFGATIGDCVHTAGILRFLEYASSLGHKTVFLGTRIKISEIVVRLKKEKPNLVALSYRLTPEVGRTLFQQLTREIKKNRLPETTFVFGGTEPVCRIARKFKVFDDVISGPSDMEKISALLSPDKKEQGLKNEEYPQSLVSRIQDVYPYPLIRHHFGRPSLEETIKGARKIALAKVLDILSLGPDQNAQEYFFHPTEMARGQDGAGGVPVRSKEDLKMIYQATRCGNYPLVRCYSGTNDLLKWAQMLAKTINNAWAAIPLFWYSVLDGRSKRPLRKVIKENQSVIRWHARMEIPVEINDSHQWGLRRAPDSVEVATAFLAAYNAKKLGVRDYIFQYMFNTPAGISPAMDLAKMLAKKEMLESLSDNQFRMFTMVRAGLASLSSDPDIARGQLAASTVLALFLKPHIIHVVGYSEGDHAARPNEVIGSCKIVHGVLKNSLYDWPTLGSNFRIRERKEDLKRQAGAILEKIRFLGKGGKEPFLEPEVLTTAVKEGILDAPDLKRNPIAKGVIKTKIINGRCCIIDPQTNKIMNEVIRLKSV